MLDAPDPQTTGNLGESLACDALRARGYAILATRYRTRFGEIDIVSEHDGVLVFVEVKARRGPEGSAVDAITPAKQRRVAAMALDYLAWMQKLDAPCRFDVVAIDRFGTNQMTVRVIQDAWVMDG